MYSLARNTKDGAALRIRIGGGAKKKVVLVARASADRVPPPLPRSRARWRQRRVALFRLIFKSGAHGTSALRVILTCHGAVGSVRCVCDDEDDVDLNSARADVRFEHCESVSRDPAQNLGPRVPRRYTYYPRSPPRGDESECVPRVSVCVLPRAAQCVQ